MSKDDLSLYRLDVRIANKNFTDYLSISRTTSSFVTGFFEVPNNFKAPFNGRLYRDELVGTFIATEAGKSFTVELVATLFGRCSIEGSLLQSKNVFGIFTGKMEGCNE
jgi:hypothetical protein